MSGTESIVTYVCKYTPIELFAGFGAKVRPHDSMPADIDLGGHDVPANLCGFGRAVLQTALAGGAPELVLVNCCDVMRRVYDILEAEGCCRFLYLLDLPHCASACATQSFARGIERLADAYGAHCGRPFDLSACLAAFGAQEPASEPYIAVTGARVGRQLEETLAAALPLPVRNLTCTSGRAVTLDAPVETVPELWDAYARALLGQIPCRRMGDAAHGRRLLDNPQVTGVVYHTIQFCDFYNIEYAELEERLDAPMLKIETDFTLQSAGQLSTRISAFSESLEHLAAGANEGSPLMELGPNRYVAGLDSGSTSTDVVIMDSERRMVAWAILPTGGGARSSAERSLAQALAKADIPREAVVRIVATGYGRDFIQSDGSSITEISCHARGAHFLDPEVRCVIDIGGQDSKVIRVSEQGTVESFVMNDKCAAGTGRFLDMMARALGVGLDELGRLGATWTEEIEISSMCTVFAESEVVTLVAQNKPVDDIVHGLNRSVATKVGSLVKRAKGEPVFMMTGGVAQNEGVVRALEERVGAPIRVSEHAQLCGAIGAALFALEGR